MRKFIAVLFSALLFAAPLSAQVRQGGAVKADGSESGSGSGTVTTTGTLASGQVALGSGATSITGDAGLTYSGTGAGFRLFVADGAEGAPSLGFAGSMGFWKGSGGLLIYAPSSTAGRGLGFYYEDLILRAAPYPGGVSFTSGAIGAPVDLRLSRASAGLLLVEDGSGAARDVQARTVTASNHIISVGRFTENYGNGGLFLYGGAGSAIVGWSSALGTLNTPDVALSRASAGRLLVEDGSGNARDVQARTTLVGVGSSAAPGMAFSSDPANGWYTPEASPSVGKMHWGYHAGDGVRFSFNDGLYEFNGSLRPIGGANTRDIGASGIEWRTGYFGTSVVTPVVQLTLATPTTSGDTCTAGTFWADASYLYVCTATNTIKRAALSAF